MRIINRKNREAYRNFMKKHFDIYIPLFKYQSHTFSCKPGGKIYIEKMDGYIKYPEPRIINLKQTNLCANVRQI